MERFGLKGELGGIFVDGLGNASPHRIDVEYAMGGMQLDLRGEWVNDSEISIRFGPGGGIVRVPDNVRVEGLVKPLPGFSPPAEIPAPTLHFTNADKFRDLEIVR